MEILWVVPGVAVLLALVWIFWPYFIWREVDGKAIEAHISRTSFHCRPGELLPPKWTAPELALSVIVPAYNEEYRLPQMLDETLTYLDERAATGPVGAFSYEVIVVDDGSRDGTYAAALETQTLAGEQIGRRRGGELRVMQLTQNRGKGFAVKAGVLAARGRLILMADADGATSIRNMEHLERALERQGGNGMNIVFGSRFHLRGQEASQRSFPRNFLMFGFRTALWLIIGGPLHDTQCGFKLFRSDVGKHIFASLHLFRWAFDIEIVLLARILGFAVAEVPVTFVDMPGSKLNLVTGSLTMLRDILLVRLLYVLGVWQPAALTGSAFPSGRVFASQF